MVHRRRLLELVHMVQRRRLLLVLAMMVHLQLLLVLAAMVQLRRRRWFDWEQELGIAVHDRRMVRRMVRIDVLDGRRKALLLEGGRRDRRLLGVGPSDIRRRPALVFGERLVAPHHRRLFRRFRLRLHEAEYVARVIRRRLEARDFAGAARNGRRSRHRDVVCSHDVLQEAAGVEAAVIVVAGGADYFDRIALRKS